MILEISYINIDEISPNTWNPNVQTAFMFDKTMRIIHGFI